MVDRSDRFDGAWADGPDDDSDRYPVAPLPAHERAWRHPSELGQAQWALTEPPVVIGRGLLATTGVLGCTLGIAALWLLLPGGLDQGPVAAPTVARSVGAVTGPGFGDTPRTGLLTPAAPSVLLPAESVPPPTVALRSSGATRTPATAVLLEGTGLLLTTAAAVRDLRTFSIEDASSTSRQAEVLVLSGDVAVLATGSTTSDPVDVLGFDAVARADAGDDVVLLAAAPLDIRYPDADEPIAMDDLDATRVPEGTPVVDADGALVGLCTHRTAGDGDTLVHVVPIAEVFDALLRTDVLDGRNSPTVGSDAAPSRSSGDATPVWIGVELSDATDRPGLLVGSVTTDSPAEAAGILAGDLIVDISGSPVGSIADARAALADQVPGSTVTLGVIGSDGIRRDLSVVLGAAPDV